MDMTQEKANEIAFLICVEKFVTNAVIIGEIEFTAEDFHKISNIKSLTRDLMEVLHLEEEEAIEFFKLIFKDATKAFLKRKELETEMDIEKMRAEHGVYS